MVTGRRFRTGSGWRTLAWLATGMPLVGGVMLAASCSAVNPAFVDVLVPGGGNLAPIDNAPGHVVIQFVNNAEVNDRLLGFLESAEGGGLILSSEERRQLRPRVRIRFLVTFVDGSQTEVEFVDGSRALVSPIFDADTEPDLNQNDLDNVVVLCDVQRVELTPGSFIEVFVPSPIEQYELVEVVNINGVVIGTTAVRREIILPQFTPLGVDVIDVDGNVVVRRNIGIRDVPAPVDDLLCGSVVTIVLEGELSVPFLDVAGINRPSFDQDDESAVGSIGGRYEFIIGVQ